MSRGSSRLAEPAEAGGRCGFRDGSVPARLRPAECNPPERADELGGRTSGQLTGEDSRGREGSTPRWCCTCGAPRDAHGDHPADGALPVNRLRWAITGGWRGARRRAGGRPGRPACRRGVDGTPPVVLGPGGEETPGWWSVGGFLRNRAMLTALAREGFPRPSVPPLGQSQSGELGRQVEFRRPHIPEGNRSVLAGAVDGLDVVRTRRLGGDVVDVDAYRVGLTW